VDQKFRKFSDDIGHPPYFPKPLPIVYIVFCSQDICHIVEKPNRCIKFFGPQFFGVGATATFLWCIVSAIYCSPFGNVRLSSICWSPSASVGNEAECQIYGGWV